MLRLLACLVLLFSAPSFAAQRGAAELRAIDKLTGKVETFDVQVGHETRFRRLVIRVDACETRQGAIRPEAAAFLEIFDSQLGPSKSRVFSGWMFASSPALSALDHPRYDVWVLGCKEA